MPQGTSAPNLHRADVSKAASRPLAHRSCRTLGQLRNDQNLSSSRTVIATTFRILFASGTLLWASSTLATPVTPRMSSADWDSEFSALLAGLAELRELRGHSPNSQSGSGNFGGTRSHCNQSQQRRSSPKRGLQSVH